MTQVREPRPWPAAPLVTAGSEGTLALLAVGGLTLLRVVLLFLGDYELYGDEAQYWSYAVEPAFGYYSKPPMVAWMIQAGMLACGAGEACLRLASPLLHGAAALLVFALARALFDARAALWSAVVYATLPGVSYSALLISTDVPLLAFWTLALLALVRLRDRPGEAGWAWLLGLAFGLGLLSKYAMGYLLLCLVVYALVDAAGRRLLADRRLWGGLALGMMVWSPNLLWNLWHGGATLLHVGENANLGTEVWQPMEGLGFLGAQFGVMGPILFAALLWRVARLRRRPAGAAERFLLAFSLPMLAVVLVQAFLHGANANWAATAFPAATVLLVAGLLHGGGQRLLTASTGLHLAVAAALAALVLVPAAARLPVARDLMAQVSGWRALARDVEQRVAARDIDVVLLDHRYPFAELWYYSDLAPPRLRMWVTADVSNHYELVYPFEGLGNGRALYVTERTHTELVTRHFALSRPVAPIAVPTAGGKARRYQAIVLEGYRRP